MSRFLIGLAALGALAASTHAAEPLAIDLEVRSGKASKTAHAESAAPDFTPGERGVLEVKAGDRVTVKWKMSGTAPAAKIENITVHFFAVKEDMIGQKAKPKLDKGVVAESACTLDFGPGAKNEGELSFTIDDPGSYLFRVETIGAAAGSADHDDFAAIDVKAR